MKIIKKTISAFIAIATAPLFFQTLKAEDAPTITKDSNNVVDVTDTDGGTVTFTVSGGSTDSPPDDLGCPPWTRTGNNKWTWHVEQAEAGPITTSPADSTTTTSNTLTVTLTPSQAGKINVSASLQEEWKDSSETPQTQYWPQ